jgi:hypothetical protein
VRRRGRVDDAAVGTWTRLRDDLIRLEEMSPQVLRTYPDPRGGGSGAPYAVGLAAYAEDVAAELYAAYGTHIRLTVGALPYPPARATSGSAPHPEPMRLPVVDDLGLELDGPLVVRSGHDAEHPVRITNHTGDRAHLQTSGVLDAVVADPRTGRAVGGSTLPSQAVLVQFTVPAGEGAIVPVFVGTESFEPSLGYRVPPGEWNLLVLISVRFGGAAGRSDVRNAVSPPLPFTITE